MDQRTILLVRQTNDNINNGILLVINRLLVINFTINILTVNNFLITLQSRIYNKE